jgi:integrase
MRTSQAPRLTPRRIENLPPRDKPYRVPDNGATAPGLMLLIYPSGRRAWLSRLTVSAGHLPPATLGEPLRRRPGRRVDVQIGPWPQWNIDDARERHSENAAAAARGHDPRYLVAASEVVPLFGDMMELWLAHLTRLGEMASTTIAAHRQRWQAYLSRLDGVPVDQLSRQHIAPELTRAAERSPVQARATLSTLRTALEWAHGQGWIEDNPAAAMKPSTYGGKAGKARSVTLTIEEIREVWSTLEVCLLSPAMVAALRMLILTGARRAEVAGMRWEEVDIKDGVWHLPAARTKTKEDRDVYLCEEALEILRARLPAAKGPVFRAIGHDKPLTPDSLSTAVKRLQRQPDQQGKGGGLLARLGAEKPFTVHDLRRSAATLWGEHLAVAPHIIERLLGHAPANAIEAVYQRQRYQSEQREVIDRWGALLLDHVINDPGAAVVPFRRNTTASV